MIQLPRHVHELFQKMQIMLTKLTRDPRRTSIGTLRPQLPPQDRMLEIRRNASLDMSLSFLEVVQLSQVPANTYGVTIKDSF